MRSNTIEQNEQRASFPNRAEGWGEEPQERPTDDPEVVGGYCEGLRRGAP